MTITWISGIALVGLILALLLAPAFEVRLSKRITNPVIISGLFLSIALMLGNAAGFVPDSDAMSVLGIISGIAAGLGLFFLVVASCRFALYYGDVPLSERER